MHLNLKFTTVGFTAQSISHHISFARGVMNIHVEIGYCLEPSLLAEIQVWMSKQVLQTLVVGVYLATITDEVVSPHLQCINHCCQFEIMRWIIFFVRTQLTRDISNHFALLHKDTTKSLTRCVAVYHEVLLGIRRSKQWWRSELVLESL